MSAQLRPRARFGEWVAAARAPRCLCRARTPRRQEGRSTRRGQHGPASRCHRSRVSAQNMPGCKPRFPTTPSRRRARMGRPAAWLPRAGPASPQPPSIALRQAVESSAQPAKMTTRSLWTVVSLRSALTAGFRRESCGAGSPTKPVVPSPSFASAPAAPVGGAPWRRTEAGIRPVR
jgi:hypothetical protein